MGDRLSEPSNLVGVAEDPPVEKVPEIDTLEAHAELIKMREKLRAEQEAENLVEKMKDHNYENTNAEYEYLSIESPEQSEDFNSTELNFGEDSPAKSGANKDIIEEKSVAIVNHGMIVSAKTTTVERVIIPEKNLIAVLFCDD